MISRFNPLLCLFHSKIIIDRFSEWIFVAFYIATILNIPSFRLQSMDGRYLTVDDVVNGYLTYYIKASCFASFRVCCSFFTAFKKINFSIHYYFLIETHMEIKSSEIFTRWFFSCADIDQNKCEFQIRKYNVYFRAMYFHETVFSLLTTF